MTDENKDSTPAEPVEVDQERVKASEPVEEQTEPNGGGR